ncbi:MAG: CHAD domain-containing protein [Alphaproteobacteria bacterium]
MPRLKGASLDAAQPAGEAFRTLAEAGFATLARRAAVPLDPADIETVHQLRVATRRLRALVAGFRGVIAPPAEAALKADLRWLQQALGPARDLDVFAADTLGPLLRRHPDDASLAALAGTVERQRRLTYRRAARALATRRFANILATAQARLADGGWTAASPDKALARPVGEHARRVLAKADRRLRRKGDNHRDLSLAELHEVRLAAKKLRYAGETFRALWPRGASRLYLARVEAIQDSLGAVNDAATGEAMLAGLPAVDPAAHALVTGWLTARLEAGLDRFPAVWRDYARARPWWGG